MPPCLAVIWPPQVHALVGAHVGLGIVIVLVEPRARPHVEQVLDGGALEQGSVQFGHELGDEGGGVEEAAADQHADHRGGDRFGHRHQQVRDARCRGHGTTEPVSAIPGDNHRLSRRGVPVSRQA